MADYKNYLAANILSEEKVVTYRLLSRALKVHVNTAKEMLYEFHRLQNAKRPGTVHATYLICGTKREEVEIEIIVTKDGEDEHMQSSPCVNNSMSQGSEGTGASSTTTITLTREEDLDQTRSQYDQISSIHIYSLGPHPLNDLQVLSDSSRELQIISLSEDPLLSPNTYGTINNPAVKRRTNHRPPPAPAPIPAIPINAKVEEQEPPKVKAEPKAAHSSSAKDFFGRGKEKSNSATEAESKETTPAPPALKRESSSLLRSFAKAKPKIKQENTETDSEVASAVEDEPMKDVSDDDEENYVPPAPSNDLVDSDRKNRKEREAALKKMMEDDDEDNLPTPEPEPEPEGVEDVEVLEEMKPIKEEEPMIEVSGGRRRGRRKVMKKVTLEDEEGYLVTKDEASWESFSEDEPVLPKAKAQVSTVAKSKKSSNTAGQGNIMSFFGRK